MYDLAGYLAGTKAMLAELDLSAVQRLIGVFQSARADGRRMFICGNGGSAALASHLACDLNKHCFSAEGVPCRSIALTDSISMITALANDVEYAEVFVGQLAALYQPGDALLGISGSGNSENVVRALEWVRARGGQTAGLLACGGGRCLPLCDVPVLIPTHDMQHAEDGHCVVAHLLMKALDERE